MFSLLILMIQFSEIIYEDPEIYVHFEKRFTALDEDGNLYITDHKLNHIIKYNNEGKIVATMGREGVGPGEFEGLVYLGYSKEEQRIFAYDFFNKFMNVFQRDGTLDRTILKPDRFNLPLKINGGWLQMTGKLSNPRMGLVVWRDLEFKESTELDNWNYVYYTKPGSGRQAHPLDRYCLRVSHDGRFAWLYKAKTKQIMAINLANLTIKTVSPAGIKRIEIDDDLREMLNETEHIPREDETYLPYVKELVPWREDRVLVYHGRHYLNEDLAPIVLNGDGEVVPEPLSPEIIKRTLFVGDGWRIEGMIVDEELVLKKYLD